MNAEAAHRQAHFADPASATTQAISLPGLALEITAIGLFFFLLHRLLVWALEDTQIEARPPTKQEQGHQAARPATDHLQRSANTTNSASKGHVVSCRSFSSSMSTSTLESKSSRNKSSARTTHREAVPERSRSPPAYVSAVSSGSRFYANVVLSNFPAKLTKPRKMAPMVSTSW